MLRRRAVLAVLLLAVLATGCAGATCARTYTAPPGPPRAFLWEVRGERGAITLIGTWHGAGAGDVPAAAWARLDAAEIYVAEVAEVDEVGRFESAATRAGLARALELPAGQSLARLLAETDWYDLVDYLGVRGEQLARYKPWVAMYLLTKRAFVTPTPNIDAALRERARARGLATQFLETWAEQVAALDAAVGAPELAQAIHEDPTMRCVLEDSYAAYQAGDDARMGGALAGQARDELLVQRNARWLPMLVDQLEHGRRALVAVGVGHLVGDEGVVVQLARLGYAVTRAP